MLMVFEKRVEFPCRKKLGIRAVVLEGRVERALILGIVQSPNPKRAAQTKRPGYGSPGVDYKLTVWRNRSKVECRYWIARVAVSRTNRVIVGKIFVCELLKKTQSRGCASTGRRINRLRAEIDGRSTYRTQGRLQKPFAAEALPIDDAIRAFDVPKRIVFKAGVVA